MKRMKRNLKQFEIIDLFTAMARDEGFRLDDTNAIDNLIDTLKSNFQKSKSNPIQLYGKHTESLFAYVAGSLENIILLKQEDSGEIYCSNDEIKIPDFRLILKDETQILVEVKNCHSKVFSIKKNEITKLQKYAELNKVELKLAIYFSLYNKWFLLSLDSLNENNNSFIIDFKNDMGKSEMNLLGDRMLATTPNLELILELDNNKKNNTDGYDITKIRVLCSGSELENKFEKNLAIDFIRYGEWEIFIKHLTNLESQLIGVHFIARPKNFIDGQHFQIIGMKSSIISNKYKDITCKDGKIISISPQNNPSEFSVFIPKDYNSSKFPIWSFILQPNK